MPAQLIAYPPDAAAVIRTIPAGGCLRIGRTADAGLLVDHPSVSRVHAELTDTGDGWHLRDLDSKNGSFIDGVRAGDHPLPPNCWLRFGDVHCEFSALGVGDDSGVRRAARQATAAAHTTRLQHAVGLDDLLDASLRAVLELAQCERGFVLLQGEHGHEVRASLALDPSLLADRRFRGSIGAVQRALAQRRPVIVHDIARIAWLAERASVISAGLDALVCLPLLDGTRELGAIYADRVRPGPPIDTLDAELLGAFAENAALWIAARQASERLQAPAAPRWDGIVAAHAGDAA